MGQPVNLSVYHASPHKFEFPDYELLTKNKSNHDNGLLGLWVATESDWIKGFGKNVYSLNIEGVSQNLSIQDLHAWANEADGPQFYEHMRATLMAQGIDYLRLVEIDGRSDMGIVLNFQAIGSFSDFSDTEYDRSAPQRAPAPGQ
jgi:hypothetical protein